MVTAVTQSPHLRIVVVGGGGREHAIADTLVREGHSVTVTPGNPGIAQICGTSSLDATQLEADLFVIGPEAPLVDGLADRLRQQGKSVFGPGRDGAMLEGSKDFMKEIAASAKVPTANYRTFDNLELAISYLRGTDGPYVIKTDGLAAGKGVLVTSDLDEAILDVTQKLSGTSFGDAGRKVIIEECLVGNEISLMVVCDGKSALALPCACDHKRLSDGDLGPNTGGMGAYSPVAWFDEGMTQRAMDEIVHPTLAKLTSMGIDYRGLLYAGLIITQEGPKLIEFNVRFGDPEAQVILPQLEGQLGLLLLSAAKGDLDSAIVPNKKNGVVVVMAAPGYPESPKVNGEIIGLGEAAKLDGVRIFHSGTKLTDQGAIVVGGGRVIGVCGFDEDLRGAISKAYRAVDRISFDGAQFRRDIAAREE
ncbi:phosphoribosylamine--glycine ligase [Acidithrix sp. C25]|uniref:Phosphoribosylamine--glycine ligase n=1 Tax=Acidithrix ferrooxidans TaxID=1280514 RepID=A0A0D8HJ63_9ACTN|nr:phosphoribosylamine--glycine ligase [Acidithrix sp. C25]KJF17894.1 phosphoribosylamine--glycine ligase [Acidithrix ferrooxidans]